MLRLVSAICLRVVLLLLFPLPLLAQEMPAADTSVPAESDTDRPAKTVLEAQVELHRRGFSCGSIDGVMGLQTSGAIRAFQQASAQKETGMLDLETRELLRLMAPILTTHVFSEEELAGLRPLPITWLEKSQ